MAQLPPISAEFPFEPHYVEVLGSRMHYVEVGQGPPVLFLHGNPTWSYLWRNVLPHTADAGRCIAVDLIGMGRSDKPDLDYRFVDHARYLDAFIEALDLRDLALVVHDWGSGLGFHYARRHEDNVRGIAFMEAILKPLASWDEFPAEAAELFKSFRTDELGWQLIVDQNVFVERVLPGSILRKLSDLEMAAYREPFADPPSRKPVWRWPNEIPIAGEPTDVAEIVEAYAAWLQRSHVPKLLLHAEPGALTRAPVVAWCREHLPSLATIGVGGGSHFIQEDCPQTIGMALAIWLRALPTRT